MPRVRAMLWTSLLPNLALHRPSLPRCLFTEHWDNLVLDIAMLPGSSSPWEEAEAEVRGEEKKEEEGDGPLLPRRPRVTFTCQPKSPSLSRPASQEPKPAFFSKPKSELACEAAA